MCGIVGSICKVNHGFDREDLTWFQQALLVDTLRGLDSTGLFMVDNDQEVKWAKVASHPLRLMQQKRTEEIFNQAVWKGRAVVGHNRKATVGNITNENAHPFVEGHIILVHNGSVHNATEVAKDKGVEVEVDSHVIAHLLATEEDVPAAIAKLRGAFAVVWYNQQNHTLNMVRNDDRPLAFAESARAIYFASEPEMLDWTLSRRPQPNRFSSAKMLEPNKVVTFDLSDATSSEQAATFKEWGMPSSPTHGTHTSQSSGNGQPRGSSAPKASSTGFTGEIPKEGETVAYLVKGLERQERPNTGEVKYMCWGTCSKGGYYRGFLDDADAIDRLDMFAVGMYVTGKVKHLVYRNGVLSTTWVEKIRTTRTKAPAAVADESLLIRTFNNLKMTHAEWEHLCDHSTCSICDGQILFAWPKYTSVNTAGKKDERIICPDCMIQRFQAWTPKEQAWVLKNAGVNPMDYLAEKRALAAPSTIQ